MMNGNDLIITWNTTFDNLASIGIAQCNLIQNVWEITFMADNAGNILSTQQLISYFYATPPPPDLVGTILTAGAAFVAFLGVGIAVAYIYERIRYE